MPFLDEIFKTFGSKQDRYFGENCYIPGIVADPNLGSSAFFTPGSWMKKSRSGINISDHISESLVKKNLKNK
jgi:hypothetical protein